MMLHPVSDVSFAPLQASLAPCGFAAPRHAQALPCASCRWASGDGLRFDCALRGRETAGEGCAAWEREPGAD